MAMSRSTCSGSSGGVQPPSDLHTSRRMPTGRGNGLWEATQRCVLLAVLGRITGIIARVLWIGLFASCILHHAVWLASTSYMVYQLGATAPWGISGREVGAIARLTRSSKRSVFMSSVIQEDR